MTFKGKTLAAAPPHSGPQFKTYAVLLSALKAPQIGWSKPEVKGSVCLTTQFGLLVVPLLVNVIRVTVLMLSLNTNSFVLSGLRTRKCAPGTAMGVFKAPVLTLKTSTTPEGWPRTGAFGTAANPIVPSVLMAMLSVKSGSVRCPASVSDELVTT